MTISTQKDLAKLVKLCRSLGVTYIKVDNIELNISDLPIKIAKSSQLTNKHTGTLAADFFGNIDENTKIETPDELTEEQLLFYSAQSHEQVEA